MRPKQFSKARKLLRPDAQSRGISAVIASKGPGQLSCHIQTEDIFGQMRMLLRYPASHCPHHRGKLLVSQAGPEPEPALIAVSWQPSNVRAEGNSWRLKTYAVCSHSSL